MVKCQQCGSEIIKASYERKGVFLKRKFCSHSCATKNHHIKLNHKLHEKREVRKRTPTKLEDINWLFAEYVTKERSADDIARDVGRTKQNVFDWLKKHGIASRTPKQSASICKKQKGASGDKNPMFGRRGKDCPSWRGGLADERKAYNGTKEWKIACKTVWVRDKATCQRCGKRKDDAPESEFHLHHIIGFSVKEKRYDPNNLILLCVECHRFVHSRKNKNRDFLSVLGHKR